MVEEGKAKLQLDETGWVVRVNETFLVVFEKIHDLPYPFHADFIFGMLNVAACLRHCKSIAGNIAQLKKYILPTFQREIHK